MTGGADGGEGGGGENGRNWIEDFVGAGAEWKERKCDRWQNQLVFLPWNRILCLPRSSIVHRNTMLQLLRETSASMLQCQKTQQDPEEEPDAEGVLDSVGGGVDDGDA